MLADLFNKHYLVRRLVLSWMMVITTILIIWAMKFAVTSPRSGADIAMILAAVLTPWTTLQGFVFKFYNEARNPIAPKTPQ